MSRRRFHLCPFIEQAFFLTCSSNQPLFGIPLFSLHRRSSACWSVSPFSKLKRAGNGCRCHPHAAKPTAYARLPAWAGKKSGPTTKDAKIFDRKDAFPQTSFQGCHDRSHRGRLRAGTRCNFLITRERRGIPLFMSCPLPDTAAGRKGIPDFPSADSYISSLLRRPAAACRFGLDMRDRVPFWNEKSAPSPKAALFIVKLSRTAPAVATE